MVRLVIGIAIVIAIVICWSNYLTRNHGPEKPPETPEGGTSSPVGSGEDPSPTVSVSINAIPWARVFIKLPENDYFMGPRARDFTIPPEPNDPKSNVTPIRGALVLPEETEIKLVYQEKEKIFPYEEWKGRQTISHDFSGQ